MQKYSSYILYLLISILVVILFVNDFGPMASLQRSINDLLCRISAESDKRPNIVLVTIDGRAEEAYGYWPWNHDLIADLMAATASGEPRSIALNFVISEDAAQDSAGYTDILAGQLSWMKNVVMPYDIALANYRTKKTNNPEFLFRNSIVIDNPIGLLDEDASLLTRKVFLPPVKVLDKNPYLGFKFEYPDEDRILRWQPMIMFYEGYYYPSLPLLAASLYLNVPPENIKVTEDDKILLGQEATLRVNDKREFFINYAKPSAYLKFSAVDVLGEDFNLDVFKDKLVVIGVDNADMAEMFETPIASETPSLLIEAAVMENIINHNMLVERNDLSLYLMLAMFAIGGLCAFILPRVNLMYRMIILFIGLVLVANINYFMFTSFHMIVNMMYFALELLLFMGASPLLDSALLGGDKNSQKIRPKASKISHAEPSRDKASKDEPVKVKELKASPTDQENVATQAIIDSDEPQPQFDDYQTLNLDHSEDQGHKTEATPTESQSGGTDISGDITFSEDSGGQNIDETQVGLTDSDKMRADGAKVEGSDDILADSQPIFDSQKIPTETDLKNLGRYQVIGNLGKGAMGMVYKGIDPAINRPVALKTIRLDFVNDPEEMAELKERLHREAQAAGKLSHPNIVSIFDVGSEGHLQYIVMEYLEGQTLEEMIKRKVKFNYRIIAQIIAQICSALEYAHDQGIVHRDIKPANIMVLSDYRVKVMDYGIARIDSNSMTKTGIAMGTPNYISPEQLRGLKTDRRADIWSLGVVIYEMLIGRRPFKGENITSLIYSIINNEPEKPSNLNPQIPLLFDHIIGRALRKNPQERYQKASELMADLKDFMESFASR